MGSGKTTIGRLLSKNLNKDFYDSDNVVEEKTGVKVPLNGTVNNSVLSAIPLSTISKTSKFNSS